TCPAATRPRRSPRQRPSSTTACAASRWRTWPSGSGSWNNAWGNETMSLWTLKARADRLLRALPGPDPRKARTLARLREDPARALAGLSADPWQSRFLRSPPPRTLALCSRQSGKSTAAAALALWTALCRPGSLTLLLSPTLRQSGELFRDKLLRLY